MTSPDTGPGTDPDTKPGNVVSADQEKRGLALHWKIVIGLGLGVLVGVALNRLWSDQTWASIGVNDAAAYLAGKTSDANSDAGAAAVAAKAGIKINWLVGKLFMSSLKFIAVPITLCALIVGVASLGDPRKLGRIGGRTIFLFVLTTVASIVIGLGISGVVKPGSFVDDATKTKLVSQRAAEAQKRVGAANEAKSFWDQAGAIVPDNPIAAMANTDMLQVVFIAVVIGAGLAALPRAKSAPVLAVLDALADAILLFVRWLMNLSPYAVFALMAPIVAGTGFDVLAALGVYAICVVAGLAVVLLVVYPILLKLGTRSADRMGMSRFYRGMSPAMLVAFSSSSSNATLPVTMECSRDRLGVSEEITSFVCPLGATVNMNGTALYQAVAVTFLAQIFGVPLTITDQIAIVVMSTLSAIGTAGVPGASIVLIVMVLQAVHVPVEGIAILLAVDRVLDMCRTVVNITGDVAVATVVASREGQLGEPTDRS